jgi:hypothetical protein
MARGGALAHLIKILAVLTAMILINNAKFGGSLGFSPIDFDHSTVV